jgi:hypothetical protein
MLVQCDQKRPSCSQCIRSGKECYGYRDTLSMMFKDETAVVAKKAEKRYEALAQQHSPADSKPRERQLSRASSSRASPVIWTDTEAQLLMPSVSSISRYPTPESMTREITPSIEDQAMGFFISNHVSQPALVPRGQYEWLLEALSQPGCDQILRSSANAASLAGLANSTKNPTIMAKARAAYGSALRMTNSALGVKERAVKDSTLMSVIMLGLYENISFQDKQSTRAWYKHVQGASALLVLRGTEQFKSNVARRIFHHFYGITMLCSLESGEAVPDGIRDLYEFCNPTSDYGIQGRQWTTRMSLFMQDSIDLNRDKDSDPVTMVTKAINLDRELDSIKAIIPKVWQYETVRLERPSDYAFGSFYHIYMDPWIAQMWNNLRLCRMHLYKVMLKQLWKGSACVPPLFTREEVAPQVAAAERVIRTTTAAICASVPQLTGMIIFPEWPISKPTGPRAGLHPEIARQEDARYRIHPPGTFLDPGRPTCMYHLSWPLYAAGSSDLSSSEMRQYAIDMLYFVALRIGTRQAVVLAEALKEMQRSSPPQSNPEELVFRGTFEA